MKKVIVTMADDKTFEGTRTIWDLFLDGFNTTRIHIDGKLVVLRNRYIVYHEKVEGNDGDKAK